jgi:hypothetical protein
MLVLRVKKQVLFAADRPHQEGMVVHGDLTLSWPAGHICPTYKESFQVRWDNSSSLFLHAAIYLEVYLFRWTSQNAFSRETAVYKWYCVHCCIAARKGWNKFIIKIQKVSALPFANCNMLTEVPDTCGSALIVRTVCSGRNKLLLAAVTALQNSG